MSQLVLRAPCFVLLFGVAACGSPAATDGGLLDGGSFDGARDDAGELDAGEMDAAPLDAGAFDASVDLPPAIFRTPDANAVCEPTPAAACTPGDLAWLASEYGSQWRRAPADAIASEGKGYRLVALVEREGPSNLDVFVVDETGAPIADLPVAFWFSSAPETSRPDEWYPQRVTARTGADGRVGFALASSAYLPTCGAGGPHAIWVSEPGAAADTTVPSDVADALGMLGGTNHRHLDLLFQRVTPGITMADAVRCPLVP